MAKDFSKIIDSSLDAVKKINQSLSDVFSRFVRRKITVQAEVKGVEKVEEAKQKLQSLPKTKTVKMKVEKSGDFSALEMTGNNLEKKISVKSKVSGLDQVQQLRTTINTLPKTITVTPPPVGPWSKMNGIFQSLRSGVHNFASGLKHASDVFISSGGGAMVLIEGFKSLINIGKHFYGEWIDGMKEAAAMSENNASSIREAAQANEELRQKGDEYLKQLEQFSMQENLSNANKAQAVKTIGELTKAYGDLGIKLDETTGKLTGVDSAMIKKAEKDKARRIKEQEARIRELSAARDEQDKIIGKETFWTRLIGGGTRHTEEAQKKRGEITRELNEARIMLNQLRKNDPAGELRAKKKAETARQEEEYKRRQRAFEDRKHDDAFAAETDTAKKIANRQFMLDRHNREVLDPLRKKIAAAEVRVKNTTGDDQTEARRNLMQLKTEYLSAEQQAYAWQKQIDDVRRRSGQPVPASARGTAAGADGKNNQNPPRTGKGDAGTAQNQSKQPAAPAGNPGKTSAPPPDRPPVQNPPKAVRPEGKPKPEAGTPPAPGNAGQNGQILATLFSSRDKSGGFHYGAMQMAYQGKGASEQRVLREAEQRKGSQLTESEIEAIRKLHELTCQFNNRGSSDFGGMAFRTDSLIARGGFQTGVTAPDTDKYNRIIADNGKATLSVVQRIETICRKFGNF